MTDTHVGRRQGRTQGWLNNDTGMQGITKTQGLLSIAIVATVFTQHLLRHLQDPVGGYRAGHYLDQLLYGHLEAYYFIFLRGFR